MELVLDQLGLVTLVGLSGNNQALCPVSHPTRQTELIHTAMAEVQGDPGSRGQSWPHG